MIYITSTQDLLRFRHKQLGDSADTWGRRLRTARRQWEERHDTKLTLKDLGARVATVLQRDPYPHTTVRAWLEEGQEPESFSVVAAIAQVLGVSAGWLAFGEDVPRPKPDDVPRTNGETPAEVAYERDMKDLAKKARAAAKKSGRRRA